MAQVNSVSWLAVDQVAAVVRPEAVLIMLALATGSWIFYKFFLKKLSSERHRIFLNHYRNLVQHISIGLFFFGSYELSVWYGKSFEWLVKLQPYVGFLAVLWGCVVFVKIIRIIAYQYLFLGSMKVGVPMLLVNIFTLLLSLVVLGWLLTVILQINLTPLLATSAVLSIVLGLALQDTLGNLFAGVALQIDKPYELGDWVEIKGPSDKIVGQVQEISWRSTVLLAITDELVTIPNRNMAQWQISNFAGRERPFFRSQIFRVPHDCSLYEAKEVLLATALSVDGILRIPSPAVIATETTESWVTLKVVFSLRDYGAQFGIMDRFITSALSNLRSAGIPLATTRLLVEKTGASSS